MSRARPKKPSRSRRRAPLSIRLRPDMDTFLRAEAAREQRPVSNLIEKILEDYRSARYDVEQISWDEFWAVVHTTAREVGLDELTEDEVVTEVQAARRQLAARRRRG